MPVGRELKDHAVEVTRACASAVDRSSGMAARAVLIVNGTSAPFCDQFPIETYAVAWLLAGSLISPLIEPAFRSLFGHSDSRPCIGPAVGESLIRSGLSQTSVVT